MDRWKETFDGRGGSNVYVYTVSLSCDEVRMELYEPLHQRDLPTMASGHQSSL